MGLTDKHQHQQHPRGIASLSACSTIKLEMLNYLTHEEIGLPTLRRKKMVGLAGLEPARPYGQQILSLQRLPFRHRPNRL